MSDFRVKLFAAAMAAAFAVPAEAQPYGPGMMAWGDGYFWLLHLIFWAAVLIAIVALLIWLVRSLSPGGGVADTGPMPMRRSAGLDVLEERYARGEINRDEFLQKKKDIVG